MWTGNITSTPRSSTATTAKGARKLQRPLYHRNQTTERISDNFERFNPYAAKALELGDDADVFAHLALAFELSQLRYQLSTKRLDAHQGARNTTKHNGR